MRNVFILAAAALLAASPAFAQQETEPEQPKVKVVYRAVEDITFDPVIITTKPVRAYDGLVWGRGDEKFESMIEERAHFKKDLAKSIRLNVKVVETTTK